MSDFNHDDEMRLVMMMNMHVVIMMKILMTKIIFIIWPPASLPTQSSGLWPETELSQSQQAFSKSSGLPSAMAMTAKMTTMPKLTMTISTILTTPRKLQQIELKGNPIHEFHPDAFVHLPALRKLQ